MNEGGRPTAPESYPINYYSITTVALPRMKCMVVSPILFQNFFIYFIDDEVVVCLLLLFIILSSPFFSLTDDIGLILLLLKQKGNYCCCSTSLDMRSTQPFNLFTSSTMTKQLSTPKLPMLLGSVSAPFVGNGQV